MSRIEDPRSPRPVRPDRRAETSAAEPRKGPAFDEVLDQVQPPAEEPRERPQEKGTDGGESGDRRGGEPGSPARPQDAKPEEPAPARGGAPRIPQELVTRLVQVVQVSAPRPGVHRVDLSLRSPGYQGMSVQLTSQRGQVSAVLFVERAAQKEALELRLPELRARLEAEGVDVASLRVETRGDGRGGSGQSRDERDEPEPSGPPEPPEER